MQVKLRHQIVENFAEHHLKCLLNDKVFNKFRKRVSELVDKEFAKQIGKTEKTGWQRARTLTVEFREVISKAVTEAAEEVLRQQLEPALDEFTERMQRYTENRYRNALKDFDKRLDEYFTEAKLDQLVEARVNDRLALAASLSANTRGERRIDLKDD